MKTWLTLATLPALLSSCMMVDLEWEQGDGVAVTEIRSLPFYDRVRLETPMHVIVKTGPGYSAYVTSDANLTGYIQTDAYAGTLTLRMASGTLPSMEPEITLIVPELRGLTHNGGGLVEIQEDGQFPDVALTVNGDGEIRYSGTASRMRAAVYGSGSIDMEGYAAFLEADLAGSGAIHGENLLAGDADVRVSGSGDVFLDLDYGSVLNLDLSGSGRIEWWGAPARLIYTLTGSGTVVEHRGLPKKTAGAKISAKTSAKVSAEPGAEKTGTDAAGTIKPGAAQPGASPEKPYESVPARHLGAIPAAG